MPADGRCRRSLSDWLYLLLLGAGVALLAWLWRFDSPPPDLYEDLAVAAGLRPPSGQLNLLWQGIAGPLCSCFGLSSAQAALRVAGHVSLGLLAVVSSSIFRQLLPLSLRRGEHVAWWWRLAVRLVVFQGAVLFCCADPIWRAFRWFSPLSLQVLLAAVVMLELVKYFRTGGQLHRLAAFAVMGVLSADTPAGGMITVCAVVMFCVLSYLRANGILPAPAWGSPPLIHVAFRLTLAFLAGFALGIAVEARLFDAANGLEAFGWTWADYALNLPVAYIKGLACPVDLLARIVAVVVLPALIEVELLRRATAADKHLLYIHGLGFAVFGLVSFSQLTAAQRLWFWTWAPVAEAMRNGLLLAGAVFLCALSVVWALAVFIMELFFRNFRDVGLRLLSDAAEDKGLADALAAVTKMQRIVRYCFLLEPLVALACVLPYRVQTLERGMADMVADVARETADECSDVDYLFTNGGLDAAVELAAMERGHCLRALSMLGGSGDPRSVYIRTSGVTNAADRAVLEIGAADALRVWSRMQPEKGATYAAQVGFELWEMLRRRDGRPMPKCSGLVARPAGLSAEDAARGAEAGRGLARRMLRMYEDGEPDAVSDHSLRDAFHFAQWSLASLADQRQRTDGDDAEWSTDKELAFKLNEKNVALARARAMLAEIRKRRTPQELLRIRLASADFAGARVHAQRILSVSPDDPMANFALGMDYFVQGLYSRAEVYLSRCLEHRPNDPAVLNNLAQCHLRQGHPDKALPFAERALETLPDSPEVKRTVERVRAALGKQADKGPAE